MIKIIGVAPASQGPPSVCKNSTVFPAPLAEGLHVWINHTESMASNQAGFKPPFGFVTSTSVEEFARSRLDAGELEQLFNECEFINLHGSGHGICTCGFGLSQILASKLGHCSCDVWWRQCLLLAGC